MADVGEWVAWLRRDRGFSTAGYQPFLAHTRRQQARQGVRVRGVIRTVPEVIDAVDYQLLLDVCGRFVDNLRREAALLLRLPAPLGGQLGSARSAR